MRSGAESAASVGSPAGEVKDRPGPFLAPKLRVLPAPATIAGMVPAIILAAGASTRMGRPKALLSDPDGRPFVVRLVRTFADAGVTQIVVVAGSQRLAIDAALAADVSGPKCSVVTNPAPERGQLSSLWVGLDAVEAKRPDGVLVTLVDVPMVVSSTVAQVITAWRDRRPPIARPAFHGRHGHPVLFDWKLVGELRDAPLDEGARAVVHRHETEIVNVEVDDEGCVVDVDTPEDYAEVLEKFR